MLIYVSMPDSGVVLCLHVPACGRSARPPEPAALAVRSGFSASYLSRVETGRRTATAAVARLYASLGPAKAGPGAKRVPARVLPQPGPAAGFGITWFGSEVRRLRIAAGKSLDGLGTEVYLSRSQLGKVEQGDARGNYQLALSLDTALGVNGQLTGLFLEECARVGPVAPDTDILARGGPVPPGARGLDRDDRAAAATARLQALRVRSHQAGPRSIVHDLGDDITGLYSHAGGVGPDAANPVWPVLLGYAELLGWTAQEIGHDAIALRWTRAMADWALKLRDSDALGYALIRQSQRAGGAETPRRPSPSPAGREPWAGSAPPRAVRRTTRGTGLRTGRRQAAYHRALGQFPRPGRPALANRARSRPSALVGTRAGPGVRALDAARGNLPGGPRRLPHRDDAVRPGHDAPGSSRTGYARLAIRHAIAYAHVGEPEHACQIIIKALPTVTRQGSASLRGDLKRLSRVLNRHRRSLAVQALLPDLTTAARSMSTCARHSDTDDNQDAVGHG